VLMVSSPLIVIVFEELLSNWPLVPIISSEPLTIVSVPVVSANGISSVTVTAPPMRILSEPVGSVSLLQLDESDHTPAASPTQSPFESHQQVQETEMWIQGRFLLRSLDFHLPLL